MRGQVLQRKPEVGAVPTLLAPHAPCVPAFMCHMFQHGQPVNWLAILLLASAAAVSMLYSIHCSAFRLFRGILLFVSVGKVDTESDRFDFRPPRRWWDEWFQVRNNSSAYVRA